MAAEGAMGREFRRMQSDLAPVDEGCAKIGRKWSVNERGDSLERCVIFA
jgi:hypothetical protein